MIKAFFAVATIAAMGIAGSVSAATLSGTFTVRAVNALNQTAEGSQATLSNAQAALDNALDGVSGYTYDDFTYTGDIDFATYGGDTTIAEWLASGVNGLVSGLDETFGELLLSKGDIYSGTATTTFFAFVLESVIRASDFIITHDDGVGIYELTPIVTLVGESVGPNSVLTTTISGFDGGELGILYVATNSDPSILKVDAVAAVPLPAAMPLLAAGLGGLALLRRRRKAS